MRILVLEDDRVQQGRIEQTLLDIGRSRNLRLEIDIAKNYGDVEKYSQYFDHYQLYLSAGALSGLCTGSGQEGKYASLHLQF